MGIPGFFMSISKQYNITLKQKLSNIDIFFDFNSLIYNAKFIAHTILLNYARFCLNLSYDQQTDFTNIYNKSAFEKIIKNLEISTQDNDVIIEIRDKLIYDNITEFVKTILAQTIHVNSLHICMDGVPLVGKMIEQRKRAILGTLINKGKEIILQKYKDKLDKKKYFLEAFLEPIINLDQTLIKPKTYFINKLEEYLLTTFKTVIMKYIKITNSTFNDNNFIFSGTSVNGEAEHKIMDIIIKKNYSNILVFSPDADMIILLLPLTSDKDIFLVRDVIKPEFFHINKLTIDIREHMYQLINNKELKTILESENIYRLIRDICFIYNIFGNDFLPGLDNVNIYDKSVINKTLQEYINFLEKSHKTDHMYIIQEDGNISWFNYYNYLMVLKKNFDIPKLEKLKNYQPKKLYNDNYDDQIYSLANYNRGIYKKPDDLFIYNNNFYDFTQYFDAPKDEIIKDYLIGCLMINILYSKIYFTITDEEKLITSLWFYKHHKAPLLGDIYNFLKPFFIGHNINQANSNIKKILREHLLIYLKSMSIVIIQPMQQLYYTLPLYDNFIKITGADKTIFPKLKEHEIFEEFLNQLHWDNNKKLLNISELVDCHLQRYINKCIPLLKSKHDNKYINLIFDIKTFIKFM
jgi:5'-3' exonuclease